MSDIIHLLPDHIANQIAAGEVIQRPSSVVKELMENAVDAGAKTIAVHITDAGRTLVQVVDDGRGMTETDARMAFERHATSKIATVDDLFALRTMGFRGEALASIAAVAQVDLRTRASGSEVGTRLSIAGSAVETIAPDACNTGSVFSVKNLFYNVPARRKFLKTNDTEFRHILTEFERVALVNPGIAFTLRHNEAVVFDLPAGLLRQRVVNIFGKILNQKLLSVDAETSLVRVEGFIGRLDTVKKRGNLQYFFVNGRYMRHPYFHKAVMQAYEQMVAAGDMPDYFIYLNLDPSTIDVNIHPTKTEIKFENERPVWQILYSAIREALAKYNSVPSIEFNTDGKIDMPVYDPSKAAGMEPPSLRVNKDYNPFHESQEPLVGKAIGRDWTKLYENFNSAAPQPAAEQYAGETAPSALFDDAGVTLFEETSIPCFQYKLRYIITPLKSGLVFIDQRRAHVRILYERYLSNIARRNSASQQLLFPEIVEFTAREAASLPQLSAEIRYLGFDLAHLGGASYAIHGVPADLTGGNPAALVKDLVSAAIEGEASNIEKRSERMALSLARATAIPTGKPLAVDEMETLVASLFSLASNGLTPDGLPVLTVFTDEELGKRIGN